MENHQYASAEKTSISVTKGGSTVIVPVSPGNADYDEIVAKGAPIADYVDPPATWETVRSERNQLLKATDWQASSDRTMSDAETVYRQALRDIPGQDVDGPGDVVWPSAP
jgi:hypothetical protein